MSLGWVGISNPVMRIFCFRTHDHNVRKVFGDSRVELITGTLIGDCGLMIVVPYVTRKQSS